MTKLSIKVKIADREYPMTVHSKDEEKVRHAAKYLNEQFKNYQDRFSIDDKSDIMAMVAFDAMVKYLTIKHEADYLNELTNEKLGQLNQLFDKV